MPFANGAIFAWRFEMKSNKFCTYCEKYVTEEEIIQVCRSHGHELVGMISPVEINKTNQKKHVKKVKGKIGEYFVESILVDGAPCFLSYNTTTDKLSIEKQIEHLDKI